MSRLVRLVGGGRAWPAVAAIGLCACGGERPPEPTVFSLGSRIALPDFAIKVRRMETVARPPPNPLNSLRASPGEKVIAVFVHWEGLEDLEEWDAQTFIEAFIEGRFTVLDEAGERTPAFSAMPADLYHWMPTGFPQREWVAVFHVYEDSERFTLLVENPDPVPGGLAVAEIPLSRP